ncbi:RDD family protein [Aliiroseovarius marinus]|uniref:RDD family protein n=1 Tax=Aliiroseovarius marinus TaxID=2500159 RepID=UPI003D7C8344
MTPLLNFQTELSTKLPKFYFFRRLFAFAIDWIIVAFLAAILTLPSLLLRGTDNVRLGLTSISLHSCVPGTSMSKELANYLGQDRVVGVRYCQHKAFFFIDNGWTANVVLSEERTGNVTKRRGASVQIDAEGNPVEHNTPDVFIAFALIIAGSAWWASNHGGQTPGKRLLGIAISTISRPQLLRREFIKWSPIVTLVILSAAMALVFSMLSQSESPVMAMFKLIDSTLYWFSGAVLGIALLWFYLSALFRKDRLAIWDRLSGTMIKQV